MGEVMTSHSSGDDVTVASEPGRRWSRDAWSACPSGYYVLTTCASTMNKDNTCLWRCRRAFGSGYCPLGSLGLVCTRLDHEMLLSGEISLIYDISRALRRSVCSNPTTFVEPSHIIYTDNGGMFLFNRHTFALRHAGNVLSTDRTNSGSKCNIAQGLHGFTHLCDFSQCQMLWRATFSLRLS